ncbi:MAG TPA: hypothetical protein VMW41_03250 [Candidatus Bathyarchaeia archaeon]|nr:hypothetical protein [Candidatus Bathyarchaeia archaeon]
MSRTPENREPPSLSRRHFLKIAAAAALISGCLPQQPQPPAPVRPEVQPAPEYDFIAGANYDQGTITFKGTPVYSEGSQVAYYGFRIVIDDDHNPETIDITAAVHLREGDRLDVGIGREPEEGETYFDQTVPFASGGLTVTAADFQQGTLTYQGVKTGNDQFCWYVFIFADDQTYYQIKLRPDNSITVDNLGTVQPDDDNKELL